MEIIFVLYTYTYLDLIKADYYVSVAAFPTEQLCNKYKNRVMVTNPPIREEIEYRCKPTKYYEK